MSSWRNNPTGAHGFTDLATVIGNRSIPLRTVNAVSAFNVVQLSTAGPNATTGQIQLCLTNGSLPAVLGIAQKGLAAGEVGDIVIEGATYAMADTTIATLYTPIKRSATTAGRVTFTTQPAAHEAIGYALSTNATTGSFQMMMYGLGRTYWT